MEFAAAIDECDINLLHIGGEAQRKVANRLRRAGFNMENFRNLRYAILRGLCWGFDSWRYRTVHPCPGECREWHYLLDWIQRNRLLRPRFALNRNFLLSL
jgi:hypothetical protein